MQMKQITLRLSKPVHSNLEAKAARTSLTTAEFIREVLSQFASGDEFNHSEANQKIEKKIDDLKRELALNLDAFADAVDIKTSATTSAVEKLNVAFNSLGKHVVAAIQTKAG
jgi:cytochrome c556